MLHHQLLAEASGADFLYHILLYLAAGWLERECHWEFPFQLYLEAD